MIFNHAALGLLHATLSFAAVGLGLVVVASLLGGRSPASLTAGYFVSAIAANASGFALPADFGIAHYLGLAAALTLAVAVPANYFFRRTGPWAPVYAVAATASVYWLVFFLIGEAFLRIPYLQALAPTLTEGPFVAMQAVAMVGFVGLAARAAAVARRPA